MKSDVSQLAWIWLSHKDCVHWFHPAPRLRPQDQGDAHSLTTVKHPGPLDSERKGRMIWLEMISTRAVGITEAEKILEICRQTHQSIAGEKLLKMTVFCNTRYATDISIHLQWKSDPGTGSVLGRELSCALEGLGLINHSLWVEQEES